MSSQIRLEPTAPPQAIIPPRPPGEGGVRAKRNRGERLRLTDGLTLIRKLLETGPWMCG
jgi:hypothetical protein